MIRKLLIYCVAVVVLLSITSDIFAQDPQVPHYISYQGKLMRPGPIPIPLDGQYTITFSIYDVDTGSIALWYEIHDVLVDQGICNVTLGERTPLDLLFDQDYWLGIQVNLDPEMTPRSRMTSTGYSYMAEDSHYFGGEKPSYYAVATHTHNFSEIKGTVSDAQVPNDITINHASTTDEANISKGMRVLASAPASASSGEVYFDTSQLKAFIYDGTIWNEYKGEKGDKGDTGDKGDKGDKPAHQWSGTNLKFQNATGGWGSYVNLKGDTGKTGAPGPSIIPAPNWNSGFVSVAPGQARTLYHNLGGNANNYLVMLDYKSSTYGINNIGYGGRKLSSIQNDGAEWGGLTSNSIGIYRHAGDKPPINPLANLGVRVRIWKTP